MFKSWDFLLGWLLVCIGIEWNSVRVYFVVEVCVVVGSFVIVKCLYI